MAAPLTAVPDVPRPAGRGAVVCIGFMGAGKSTAARSAAEALNTTAIDVDEQLEAQFGKPIARVFAEDGEAAFREAEERLTLELLASPQNGVVSLGGGAPMSPKVRRAPSRRSSRIARSVGSTDSFEVSTQLI